MGRILYPMLFVFDSVTIEDKVYSAEFEPPGAVFILHDIELIHHITICST